MHEPRIITPGLLTYVLLVGAAKRHLLYVLSSKRLQKISPLVLLDPLCSTLRTISKPKHVWVRHEPRNITPGLLAYALLVGAANIHLCYALSSHRLQKISLLLLLDPFDPALRPIYK